MKICIPCKGFTLIVYLQETAVEIRYRSRVAGGSRLARCKQAFRLRRYVLRYRRRRRSHFIVVLMLSSTLLLIPTLGLLNHLSVRGVTSFPELSVAVLLPFTLGAVLVLAIGWQQLRSLDREAARVVAQATH